jgi:hypothetical protein
MQSHELYLNPEQIINFLNHLVVLDRDAVSALINTRVPCNKQFSEHETVQVLAGENETHSVGLLGILNGLCGKDENGWGFIVAEVDEKDDKVERFIHSKDKK